MEYQEVFEAAREAAASHHSTLPQPRTLIPVAAFTAVDDDDQGVTVVGVSYCYDELEFVAIVERDGEVFPTFLASVFRQPSENTS